MADLIPAATPNYPTSLLGGARMIYEADAGVNVLAGNPVPTWQDSSGNGNTLTVPPEVPPNLPVPGPPTFLLDTDQLPYVAFDGVNDVLHRSGLTPYLGTVLTAYWVARPFTLLAGIGRKIISGFWRAPLIPGVGGGTMAFNRRADDRGVQILRENIEMEAKAIPNPANSLHTGTWSVYAARFGVVSVNVAHWHYWENGVMAGNQWGAPGTAPLAFNYDHISLGGNADLAPGFPNDMTRVDVRLFAVYHAQHSDDQVKQTMRYAAHKWKVPVLD